MAFPVAPDHDWNKTPNVSDEVRDRLSGSVLDAQGGFRSSVLVDGEAFNPRFLPCGDASCVASGAGIDRYGNPEGVAGLVVNVDKAGVLGFEIRAAQNHPFYDASGTDMFSSAMQRLGNEGIQVNQIRGAWEAGTDSVHTAQYMQNISKGMSKESAALNTWTGQISQKYGYAKVEKIETIGEITYVTFGK